MMNYCLVILLRSVILQFEVSTGCLDWRALLFFVGASSHWGLLLA